MLVYFGAILITLLGFCGLAVDVGRVEWRTAQLQAAADAGAIAAATEMQHGGSSTYSTAATQEVTQYETLNGMPTTGTVSTSFPVNYGDYTNDYSAVQVNVTQTISTLFLGLLKQANSSITVSVKATANIPPCMVFLGTPNMSSTWGYWTASANDSVGYGCPFYVKTGLFIDGFSILNGSQVISSAPSISSAAYGSTSEPIRYNAPAISDPLAYVTAPTPGLCLNVLPIVLNNPATVALVPGTYCGTTIAGVTTPAVSVTGTSTSNPGGDDFYCTSNPVITLSPGLYIFTGGIYAQCATFQGSGVTIYFTKTAGGGYGTVNLRYITLTLSASNVAFLGSIPGVVAFTDRNWVGGTQDFSMFDCSWNGDGVIYSPSTGVYDWQTNMTGTNYFSVVAANMYTYNSTVHPLYNYANLPTGNPLHNMVQLVQ